MPWTQLIMTPCETTIPALGLPVVLKGSEAMPFGFENDPTTGTQNESLRPNGSLLTTLAAGDRFQMR